VFHHLFHLLAQATPSTPVPTFPTPVPVQQTGPMPGPVTTTPASPIGVYLSFASTVLTAILTFIVAVIGLKQGKSNVAQAASNYRLESDVIEIRTFTNSALGAALKVAAVAYRRVYSLTNEPGDLEVALRAEAAADAHVAAQKVVDAQKATMPNPIR
jgi:hypothetical protein